MKNLITTILFAIIASTSLSAQCITGNCARGFGIFQYEAGHQYTGEWKEKKRHGFGTFTFANGQVQTGTWEAGQLIEGSTTFPDDSQYIGHYENSLRHGTGTPTYQDGRREQGIYERDTLVYGILKYRDSSYYHGDTYGPKPMGLGTMYYKDKAPVSGWWTGNKPEIYDIPMADVSQTNDSLETQNKAFIGNAYNETYAVIVAVEDYPGTGNDLKFTRDDAELFYKFLVSPQGGSVPAKNIIYLYDEKATAKNIVAAMDKMYRKAGTRDRAIFYFSGHGVPGAFVSYDANRMLSHDRVKGAFKRSRAQNKICIADACHAGSIKAFEYSANAPAQTKKEIELPSFSNMTIKQKPAQRIDQHTMKDQFKAFNDRSSNIAVLMSSTAREYSQERPALGHGLFTYFLVSGMIGNANLNNDKIIDITELFLFVRNHVIEASNYSQSPVLFGRYSRYMPISKIE